VTVVLVIIIVVFIVCQTPTLFQRLLLALSGNEAFDCGRPYYYVERLADYLAGHTRSAPRRRFKRVFCSTVFKVDPTDQDR